MADWLFLRHKRRGALRQAKGFAGSIFWVASKVGTPSYPRMVTPCSCIIWRSVEELARRHRAGEAQ